MKHGHRIFTADFFRGYPLCVQIAEKRKINLSPLIVEKIGKTREQCVLEAINIWMNGADNTVSLREAWLQELANVANS